MSGIRVPDANLFRSLVLDHRTPYKGYIKPIIPGYGEPICEGKDKEAVWSLVKEDTGERCVISWISVDDYARKGSVTLLKDGQETKIDLQLEFGQSVNPSRFREVKGPLGQDLLLDVGEQVDAGTGDIVHDHPLKLVEGDRCQNCAYLYAEFNGLGIGDDSPVGSIYFYCHRGDRHKDWTMTMETGSCGRFVRSPFALWIHTARPHSWFPIGRIYEDDYPENVQKRLEAEAKEKSLTTLEDFA